jgi:hypothetical protein
VIHIETREYTHNETTESQTLSIIWWKANRHRRRCLYSILHDLKNMACSTRTLGRKIPPTCRPHTGLRRSEQKKRVIVAGRRVSSKKQWRKADLAHENGIYCSSARSPPETQRRRSIFQKTTKNVKATCHKQRRQEKPTKETTQTLQPQRIRRQNLHRKTSGRKTDSPP